MNENLIAAVFFDLGDTLGTPVVSPPPVHLTEFEVFPFVPSLLQQLKLRGLRLGLISNTGQETGEAVDQILQVAGILEFFEPPLRIYSKDVGLTKADPEIFRLAAARAGFSGSPRSCLFVGEDAGERDTAVIAGLRVRSHPLLVAEELAGDGQ